MGNDRMVKTVTNERVRDRSKVMSRGGGAS